MQELFAVIQKFGNLPQERLDELASKATLIHIPQGDFFCKVGQICHQVGFVQEGIFRVYSINEEEQEMTRLFISSNHFIMDVGSYALQTPAVEYRQALTNTRLLVWNRADLDKFREETAGWHMITSHMRYSVLLANAHERTEMLNDDALTRYKKFVERYPHLMAQVPLRYIANYLGIAPQSLSRIRQQLSKT